MNDLQSLVKRASGAVEHMKDLDLKKVAFDRILQHLLDGEGSADEGKTTKSKAKAKSNSAVVRPRASGHRASGKDGPKAWLEELIDGGFFDEPRSGVAMVDKLAEHGHHLTYQDLTRQLTILTKDKALRRKKLPVKEGAKKHVWHYSKW
jgi:hypothetical protein